MTVDDIDTETLRRFAWMFCTAEEAARNLAEFNRRYYQWWPASTNALTQPPCQQGGQSMFR